MFCLAFNSPFAPAAAPKKLTNQEEWVEDKEVGGTVETYLSDYQEVEGGFRSSDASFSLAEPDESSSDVSKTGLRPPFYT